MYLGCILEKYVKKKRMMEIGSKDLFDSENLIIYHMFEEMSKEHAGLPAPVPVRIIPIDYNFVLFCSGKFTIY